MIRLFLLLTFAASIDCKRASYEESITFVVFNNVTRGGEISTFDKNLTSHGCEPGGNYAIIVHGWKESIYTPWVSDTVQKLLIHRGGCVVFMDYSNYSIVADYFRLVPHFYNIADLLLRKIKQIGNYDRLFMFGFSFGSRLCFEVGAQLGYQVIERIDGCDPAGPGFDASPRGKDPKKAAKTVACINTSIDKGTSKYDCHQNFLMGRCGRSQIAAGRKPLGNHGLCPYFYNAAFEHDFTPKNVFNCASLRPPPRLHKDLKMGYMNQINSSMASGDIFIPTSRYFPWNVIS